MTQIKPNSIWIQVYQDYLTASLSEILSRTENTNGVLDAPLTTSRFACLVASAFELIPAYSKLISSTDNGVDLFENAHLIAPFVLKKDWVLPFPIHERCFNGSPKGLDFLHCSSGSGGTPTIWARSFVDEISVASRFEQIFHDNFESDTIPTLAIICFPLGLWVGGLYTTVCSRLLSIKGYQITLATPGNNVEEILKAVQSMSPLFQQTVLLGYPPFIKTVIDAGQRKGIIWSKYHLGMVFAGEVFSEEWRALVGHRAGIAEPLKRMVSIYGTADAGVIANETPLTTGIRSFLSQHPEVARKLFGRDRLPSLMQFDPNSRYLELHPDEKTICMTTLPFSLSHQVLTSSDKNFVERGGPMPLIRYNIGDAGGINSFEDMSQFLKAEANMDIHEWVKSNQSRGYRQLPFVWVFGRAFWTVSLYGANVFVDQIMVGLEQPQVSDLVTGKFVLGLTDDDAGDTRLHLVIETVHVSSSANEQASLAETLRVSILQQLVRLNSEYANYVPEEKQIPVVELRPLGDPKYFPIGVKHKYIL